jgi:hypothetical protein
MLSLSAFHFHNVPISVVLIMGGGERAQEVEMGQVVLQVLGAGL